MIVKGKYKYTYSTINFKVSVAKRFRGFSKRISGSHSETLSAIMDFFQWHGISPFQRFAKQIASEEHKTRKRIDAVIAIIKDIEKHQTKPTTAMLQSLFEQKLETESPTLVERKFAEASDKKDTPVQTTVPRVRYERLEHKLDALKKDFAYVLDNIKPVKNSFGKDFFKLELTKDELEKYKRIVKNL